MGYDPLAAYRPGAYSPNGGAAQAAPNATSGNQPFMQKYLDSLHGLGGGNNNNPSNPFYDANGQFNAKQGAQSVLGGAFGSGAFNANGTGTALDLLKHYLTMKGEGDVRQAQLGSELYSNNDPLMGGYARMNAEQNARNNTTMGVAGAQADFAKNAQDQSWGLLHQYLAPYLVPKPKKKSAWGTVGAIGGAAIGALAGGPPGAVTGAKLGGSISGGGGGGASSYDPNDYQNYG